MSEQPLDAYFSALERLKNGAPSIVPKGIKITNDSVALEAGRGKGSIKKSRPVFADLILAIDAAAKEQTNPKNEQKVQLTKVKAKSDQYRIELDACLAREISLLHELYETKKVLAKLTGGKVLPLRNSKRKE